MDDLDLPPSAAEGPELQAYFSQLHEHFRTNADAPVGAALAEFVDVIDLASTPQLAADSPTTSWRPKMLTGIGAFVATTTGKIVLGTTVAAASVGGMHAAEIVDVPLLPEPAASEVLIQEEAGDVDQAVSVADNDAEADEAVAGNDELIDGRVGDADMDDGEDDSDEPKNHGAVVSDFAKNTELEGCEKGQAISALAKSKEKKKDQSDEDGDVAAEDTEDQQPEGDDTTDAEVSEDENSTCKSDDDDEDSEDADEEADGDGPPEGKGHNRDDHPGKGGKHSSDD